MVHKRNYSFLKSFLSTHSPACGMQANDFNWEINFKNFVVDSFLSIYGERLSFCILDESYFHKTVHQLVCFEISVNVRYL